MDDARLVGAKARRRKLKKAKKYGRLSLLLADYLHAGSDHLLIAPWRATPGRRRPRAKRLRAKRAEGPDACRRSTSGAARSRPPGVHARASLDDRLAGVTTRHL